MSLIEVSHRGKEFVAVMDRARQLVKDLLMLDDRYEVLFLQGGASLQFAMIPYNLLPEGATAAYLDTGTWAANAIKQARYFGEPDVVASSKADQYAHIPKDFALKANHSYFHFTSNNTIFGTEVHDMDGFVAKASAHDIPVLVDMSSDIFARPIDGKQYGLIYAGAQKNLGAAGTTVVAIRKDLLGSSGRAIPSMLDYAVHIEKDSMFNTPSVFAVYTCMLTMEWILQEGGLSEMEQRNQAKARLLYSEVDRNGLFRGTVAPEDRSLMNATFVPHSPDLEAAFLKACTDAGIVGLKGHRSVGGFRASMYNALPLQSVEVLVDVMKEFERTNG